MDSEQQHGQQQARFSARADAERRDAELRDDAGSEQQGWGAFAGSRHAVTTGYLTRFLRERGVTVDNEPEHDGELSDVLRVHMNGPGEPDCPVLLRVLPPGLQLLVQLVAVLVSVLS